MRSDFELFRASLQSQRAWLLERVREFQSGSLKATRPVEGGDVDVTTKLVEDYRHRANNLQTVIECYERQAIREKKLFESQRGHDGAETDH